MTDLSETYFSLKYGDISNSELLKMIDLRAKTFGYFIFVRVSKKYSMYLTCAGCVTP